MEEIPRIIGAYGNIDADTLMICTAGIHGNEPLGIEALRKVFHILERDQPNFKGRFVGIAGNKRALAANQRYLSEDLNRIWTPDKLENATNNRCQTPDCEELKEICQVFDQIDFTQYHQKIYLDLHTTSGENGTFIVTTQLAQSHYLTQRLEAPVIIGLEEKLKGTSLRYMHDQGFTSFAFEGGQHQNQQSIDNLVWSIWYTFLGAGCIAEDIIPEEVAQYTHLQEFTENLPNLMELEYLHSIKPEDQFKMLPGFKNFSKVTKGQLLAHDCQGEVKSPDDGYLLMPLYQPVGSDGFFLVKGAQAVVGN
ncbi:M14 family metallopeptidase [Microscilla marina]|uniref:Succinylglutamate desuccinylase / Aspartoacylase family n=1 Tax=Microscilla marina ATCC 23134 TaxID=313606 RepID=A1ZCU5_MICM2|nr:succinylglutamate desuccinylase/aspartoacylase family protein [Microscilla marina]EAY32097.1 succinylglutamate desuccinylase / Aspartoacylase family [Microscilla marina ATCC 23134]